MNTPSDSTVPGASGQKRARKWIKRILLGIVALVVLLALAGVLYQQVATAADAGAYPPPGQLVTVDGRQMHLYCAGEGSPTVILEQGGGGNSLAWFLLQPELARSTRVCSYDRAGMGWSDSAPEPRDGAHIAQDLHALLNQAGIPPPYVLVGHSYGGLFVRSFAAHYPDEIAGMVLLDAAHPDQWTRTPQGSAQYQNDSRIYTVSRVLARLGILRLVPNPFTSPPPALPADLRGRWNAVYNTNRFWDTTDAESRAILTTMDQIRQMPAPTALPLVVVSAGEHVRNDAAWDQFQQELAALSTDSVRLVIDDADHAALWADPKAALASAGAVSRVVAAVRSGQPLK